MATTVLSPSSAPYLQTKEPLSTRSLYQSRVDTDYALLTATCRAFKTGSRKQLETEMPEVDLSELRNIFLEIAREADNCEKKAIDLIRLPPNLSLGRIIFIRRLLIALSQENDATDILDMFLGWNNFNRYEDFLKYKICGQRIPSGCKMKVVADVFNNLKVSITNRTDLSSVKSFAIDEKNTTDIDDAISYDESKNVVLVHIADPTSYLPRGRHNSLISEAEKACQTLYWDCEKYSMFPENLSQNVLSLGGRATLQKYTITHEFSVQDDGSLDETSFKAYKSVISRPKLLSYNSVAKSLRKGIACPELTTLYNLALMRRGHRSEMVIAKDRWQYPSLEQSKESHILVEEMMISTNIVAAALAQYWKIPVIYRGSGFPGSSFTNRSTRIRYARCDKGKDIVLSTKPEPHVKLGLRGYVQVTSPIRKFADLLAQIQFSAHLDGQRPPYEEHDLRKVLPLIKKCEKEAFEGPMRLQRFRDYEKMRSQRRRSTFVGKLLHPAHQKTEASLRKSRCSQIRNSPFQGSHWNTNSRRSQTALSAHWVRNQTYMPKNVNWFVKLDNFESPIVAKAPSSSIAESIVHVRILEIDARTSYVDAVVC